MTAIVMFFYAMGLISAVDAVVTARTAQGAVAWSVTLVTFPFVAVPAYWVFGRSKFEGFLDAYDERKAEIDELVAEARANMQGDIIRFEQPVSAFEALRKLSGNEFTGRNRVELLINGEATFDSILERIAEARDYVLVQFYMIHDDGLGQRMQQALIERARAGVRILVLYDEVGSSGLPDSYVDALVAAGAEVSSFKPTQGWRNRFQLNFRNHRKIVVVDGETGWVGGHNVGDEYLGLDPDFSPWRDTHVRIDGPAVMQLQGVIVRDWYWATRKLPTLDWQPKPAAGSDVSVMIVPSAPTQQLETAGLMFVQALSSARRRIWLSAPYFVPDEAVMKALELAALRGVDVRIIVPGKGDSLLVWLAGYHYIDQLRGLGIRFYEWEPGFLHEKVAVVDGNTSLVGTANFDNRSFRLNFEVTAVIRDDDFAAEMERMFENDFAQSTPLDLASLDDKGFWWRLGVSVSRLFSPIL
ncbi:MAG: cardiolipin synthase [Gammaproteobacteria bacterium]